MEKPNLPYQISSFCIFTIVLFFCFCFCFSALAQNDSDKKLSLPAVLKADKIDGDRQTNIFNAVGNAELTKDGTTLFADRLSFDQNSQDVKASGNVKIINYDIGNVLAEKIDAKSDFKSGRFSDATIVFGNGSYMKSPEIVRKSEVETIFNRPVFSICPNSEIQENNHLAGEKRDAISITSAKTTINKETNSIKTKSGVIRIYKIPVLYTPYLSTPIPSSKRKSGILYPSYVQNTKLGAGLSIPYYFNIAPNKDLTSNVQYHPAGTHLLVNNLYRHLLKNGSFNVDLELANNRPKTNDLIGANKRESQKEVRWYGQSSGKMLFSKNIGLDFNINSVGDKNYLRDYSNDFLGETYSTINLDQIKDRDYASIKTVRIQDLGVNRDENTEPWALPIINFYKEITPKNGYLNQTYSGLFNSTIITRETGLQYRRASVNPAIKIPYNIAGNLFEVNASVQGDFYNLTNNFTTSEKDNNFDKTATNYRPQADLKWSLPLVGKYKNNTIIIEPLANIAISSYENNFNQIPNEDSNDVELTQNNLFLSDRFTGFDRNEQGLRSSYGFKSSLFNDKIGQFTLGLGQSWREQGGDQDVVIRGFNENNKSNIVGEIGYKSPKIFNLLYNFQLNESNYRNDVNEFNVGLNLGRLSVGGNYILIRKTVNNVNARKQLDFNIGFKVTSKFKVEMSETRDLEAQRVIVKRYGLSYNGCCVAYGFYLVENSPIALSKPLRSYNFNIFIKNL
ncbi:MAG: LPS-assembly protein [Rickettsiales bacterium]|jgi:LPS-assembly protein